MKIFTKPYWIFLAVTIPQILIIFYYLGIYGVISSLLEARHMDYWFLYGTMLGLMIISSSAYALFLLARKQSIHWLYALLSLAVYVIFLYAYFRGAPRMMPFNIPRWMIPAEEVYLLPVGLIMPALMHALLLLVYRFTPAEDKSRFVLTAAGAIALPALWYLLLRFGIPLLYGKISWALLEHIRMVIFVILTVAFMFVLLRLTYILMLRLQQSKLRNAWLLKTPFTLLLPLLCLLFYNGVIPWKGDEFLAGFNPLGDWSHPVYYVLVVAIGLLLTLPPARLKAVRLVGFALKALLYPFVVYFFVVFLPFFPFAVSAVVLFGLGFLLLAPLILFFFHTRSLYDDWRVLGKSYDPKVPALVFLTAFAVFPAGVTISYSMDRATLDNMLTHVYAPDYRSENTLRLDMDSARRVLDNISSVKEGADFISGKRKPYLTTYYQWLVMDNLTVSDHRLNELERVFFGAPAAAMEREPTSAGRNDVPELTKVETSTELSDDGRYYKSRVDLTMTYEGRGNGEYVTRFHLPVGAWVTDYYLVIGDEKVQGILSEKKSALWLYQQIRNTRRDPGIIYYTSPEELILRVFPFSKGESRQTGFEILHRRPLTFDVDGTRVVLKAEPRSSSAKDNMTNFVVVSPEEKAALAKQTRKPYLHFILDGSSNAARQFDDYSDLINSLVEEGQVHGVDVEGARVTIAGYAVETYSLNHDWETKARRFESEGGFFLERAVKKALYRHYRQQSDRYPVFVVVSDHIDQAVFTEGLEDFGITMPEGDMFFVLDTKQGLSARRFATPMQDIAPSKTIAPGRRQVLAWPDDSKPVAYLPDNGRASLVIRDTEQDRFDLTLDDGSWENGAKLYGLWLSSRLNPREAGQKQYSVITNSFRTHLLTPLTAFISPENDAQRQILRKKQQQMLSSRRPLDIGDENEMDEPPLWVLLLFLAALLMLGRRRPVTR